MQFIKPAPRAGVEAAAYVLFNCGASVPARAATKWTSHPRASSRGERGFTGATKAYCGGAGPGAFGWAGGALAGGFAGAGAGAGWLWAFGSGSGLSEFELR